MRKVLETIFNSDDQLASRRPGKRWPRSHHARGIAQARRHHHGHQHAPHRWPAGHRADHDHQSSPHRHRQFRIARRRRQHPESTRARRHRICRQALQRHRPRHAKRQRRSAAQSAHGREGSRGSHGFAARVHVANVNAATSAPASANVAACASPRPSLASARPALPRRRARRFHRRSRDGHAPRSRLHARFPGCRFSRAAHARVVHHAIRRAARGVHRHPRKRSRSQRTRPARHALHLPRRATSSRHAHGPHSARRDFRPHQRLLAQHRRHHGIRRCLRRRDEPSA